MRLPPPPATLPRLLAAATLLLAVSCGGGGGNGTPADNPPEILDLTRNPAVVVPGGTAILTVIASDADGDPLAYAWSAGAGGFIGSSTGAQVTWVAPLVEGLVEIGVVVTARGASALRSVFLEVNEAAPALAAVPGSLSLAGGEPSVPLYVSNVGEDPLHWTAAADSAWLQAAPAAGTTAPGESTTVTVSVDRSGLASGIRSAAVTVDSDGGVAVVPVFVTVLPQAALGVAPASLDFGTAADTLALVVSNGGTGVMTWAPVDTLTSSWVEASPAGGALGAGASDTLAVVVLRGMLPSGEHIGRLDIASDGGFATVGVRLQNP